jgi:phosphotriesterase-related protein
MNERTGKVQTVRGLVDPDELGFTHPHEHLLVNLIPAKYGFHQGEEITLENYGRIRLHWGENPNNLRLDDEAVMTSEMKKFRDAGGRTLVELTMTTRDGRDVEVFKRISEAADVHIVCGTGLYQLDYHPEEIPAMTDDELARIFIKEVTEGCDDTDIRAGVIGEIGLSWPVHDDERKALRAACLAQQDTGAVINIHPGRNEEAPLDAMATVKEMGANPEHVVMSHLDRTYFTLDEMLILADTGCYLEFDLFGQESSYYPAAPIDMPNDAVRIDFMMALMERGFHDKILFSQDICMKHHVSAYGGEGYTHIIDTVIPVMKRKGMTDDDIEQLTVKNPAAMLTIF